MEVKKGRLSYAGKELGRRKLENDVVCNIEGYCRWKRDGICRIPTGYFYLVGAKTTKLEKEQGLMPKECPH